MGATMIQERHHVEDDEDGIKYEVSLDGGGDWRQVSRHEYVNLIEACGLLPIGTDHVLAGFRAIGGKVAGRTS